MAYVNLLKNWWEGLDSDRSRLLREVVLHLLLGQTHAQQVSHEDRVIQWLDDFGHLICACTILQVWEILKVAVELLNPVQKLTNRNPVGLPQCVGYVILQGFPCITFEYLLKVEHDALQKGVPRLGRSFIMSDSEDILPRTRSHLGLQDLLPGWSGLVGE